MKLDVFLRSISAGMLAATAYALVELVALGIGLQHTSVWAAAAGMFIPIEQVATPLGTIIGLIGHTAIGGLFGLNFYILLLFFGTDRSTLKGMLFAIYLWGFSTVMMRLGVSSYVYLDADEQLGALFGTLVFGVCLGFLVPRMAMQNTAESYPVFPGLLANLLARPAYKPVRDDDDTDK